MILIDNGERRDTEIFLIESFSFLKFEWGRFDSFRGA